MIELRIPIIDFKPIIKVTFAPFPFSPNGKIVECAAVVDTGATDIVLKPKIVDALGLTESEPPVSNECVGFSGMSKVYRTCVTLPFVDVASGSPSPHRFTECRTLSENMSSSYDALIGFNVLSHVSIVKAPHQDLILKM